MWYNCKFPAHRRTPPLCVQLVVEPIIYGQIYDLLFKPSSKHGVASYLSRKLYLHAIVSHSEALAATHAARATYGVIRCLRLLRLQCLLQYKESETRQRS